MFKNVTNCKYSQLRRKEKINVDGLKVDKKFHEKEVIKCQQRFKTRRYNVFTEEINKILLSSKDDKKYNQSILLRHAHME